MHEELLDFAFINRFSATEKLNFCQRKSGNLGLKKACKSNDIYACFFLIFMYVLRDFDNSDCYPVMSHPQCSAKLE